MGWGLIINRVYLNRVHKQELTEVVEEAGEAIRSARDRLLMFAASTPRTVEDSEGGKIDWNEHVQQEVSGIMDELEEQFIRKHLAGICINNPEDVTED